VVSQAIGTAMTTDSNVTVMAKKIDLEKTIMVFGLTSHVHISESAPDTRPIK
jgi:hypothetical protein|tara:strand:- start:258 stop:413 length:156 start_codon:yes stop_codon:yes gene_type:complete